jgi:NAD(P)-dependent dehydrogenase (short-subunit alcohol dehydrogenase family)
MGLAGGALAAAVLGGILGALLLLLLLLLLLRRCLQGPRVATQARLDGKVVAVTGANTGIGRATALELSRRGAKVVLLCRSLEKAEATAKEMAVETGGEVVAEQLDLASLESVRRCADQLVNRIHQLDILVNNAGVVCPYSKTADGFEMTFGTNHLGPFLLTNLLMPLLKKASDPGAKVVNVSSHAHKFCGMNWDDLMFEKTPYHAFKAYSQSKLANILFTKELARRGEGSRVDFYSLHPGSVRTDIFRHNKQTMNCCINAIFKPFTLLMKSPEAGAQTTLHCCLEPGLRSGGYYSDCQESRPSASADSLEEARRLWALSAQLTGLGEV